jgi:cysteine synthase A
MSLRGLIGNTPMIKINYKYNNIIKSIFSKLEYYNFSGSIKDRIAFEIITKSKENGLLKDNQPIIEVTSGNTGISISAISAYYKHPVHIFVADWVSVERIKLMQMYGAIIHKFSKANGGFKFALNESNNLSKEISGFKSNQFESEYNIYAHYNYTGAEILNKLPGIESFISGIGTGGTLIGVGKRLKEYNNKINIYALEPDTLPLLSTGSIGKGSHKIEGIGDDFIPKLVDRKLIDDVVQINDEDAINMSKLLSLKLGLGVGISSGANFLAAVIKNDNNKIATVFADDNKKYLSTSLSEPLNTSPNLLSNQIELIDFEFVK